MYVNCVKVTIYWWREYRVECRVEKQQFLGGKTLLAFSKVVCLRDSYWEVRDRGRREGASKNRI